MDDGSILLADLWHLLAGLLGAFGNQVLYWRERLAGRKRAADRRMVPVFVAYVVTGGGVGFFVGVEGNAYLLALGAGAFWPETLKSLNAARRVGTIAWRRWRDGGKPRDDEPEDDEAPDEPGSESGD